MIALTEFLLEALGCLLFSRRKFGALSIWLGYRAAADLAYLFAANLISGRAGVWVDYVQRHGAYLFIAAACVSCVAGILRERKAAGRAIYAGMCALALIGVVLLHAKWPPSPESVLIFEAGVCCFLALFIVLARLQVETSPQPWGAIAGALLLLTISDAVVSTLTWHDAVQHHWAHWHYLASWYPAGAIPALALLVWSGWRDYRIECYRMPLGKKKPVTINVTWLQRAQSNV